MAEVMMAWEDLTDEDRLAWRTAATNRRMEGVIYFKQVNLRRLRRGEALLRLPPVFKPYDGRPILKRLLILNRGGRLYLELELFRTPAMPTSVWGALPCNRGKAKPNKCPRLGWLPAAEDGVCHITGLYFQKHGEYLRAHGVYLVGKRIFIRTRLELDDGVALYEEVQAVVPPPQGQSET